MKEDILRKNLLILASAGSGKTYQLGNRVIGMVGVGGVDPETIVALTFTRKAAGEFADSVLSKLGEAAGDPAVAAELFRACGTPFDVIATLERVVRALPRFQLGTMDGFFSRVVRGFQYELGLTGGRFELIQGPKLATMLSDIRADILGNALESGEAEEFLHAFKRATVGREERSVSKLLGSFFESWHGHWKSGEVGDPAVLDACFGVLPDVGMWEEEKRAFANALRRAASTIEWTRKGQDEAYGKLIDALEAHTIGSGSLGAQGALFDGLSTWAAEGGVLHLKYYKEFSPGPAAEKAFLSMFRLLAACELAAAVERTKAVIGLVGRYDRECQRRLRQRGMLGFDDVKVLMGEWTLSEEKRLQREAVDFRLDARYQHWLLDEFQDTSRAEWRGMEPLLDEAAMGPDGSLFVVGDVKQAIYGWRGGDVRLFDEVRSRYAGDLGVDSMPESWRSCEAVLELVNQVCGNTGVIEDLFGGELASRWPWENHEAARKGVEGESRVEVVPGKSEERYDRMVELMHEIGIGKRELSCGVLVRTNDQLRAVAERLREEGFDVIEEGTRKPTVDNPVGVALSQLIAWLADPADDFARGVVRMSRLEDVISGRFEADWMAWEGLLEVAQKSGFSGMLEDLAEEVWDELSEFGRRRAGDVIGALAAFDASGGVGAREALRWIESLEIAQSPGTAAVQVMTVHKSKGLGFDVVMLPEIDDKQMPDAGKFRVARGDGWMLQNPAEWVRAQFPALKEIEAKWGQDQCYEAMCVLYVALTRAKRGLYVLLAEPPKSRKEAEIHSSLSNWVMRSVGAEESGIVWQRGDAGWVDSAMMRREKEAAVPTPLGEAVSMRPRFTPSGEKGEEALNPSASPSGRSFGSQVHEAFESMGWIDEDPPQLPRGGAGELVSDLLQDPEIRRRFTRSGSEVVLYREQPIEWISEGKWMSGVIDRLHVHEGGRRVEIIDFKTDSVVEAVELIDRYAGQMRAYRRALSKVFPQAEIECLLLSTRLKEWIPVD